MLPERGKRDRRHRSAPAPCFGSVEAPASLPPLLLFSLFPPPSRLATVPAGSAVPISIQAAAWNRRALKKEQKEMYTDCRRR